MHPHQHAPVIDDAPITDLAVGHRALVVTRGALPVGTRWYLSSADHTLIVAESLTPAEVGAAITTVLTELAAATFN